MEQLAEFGVISPDPDGNGSDLGDVHRVRLLLAFEEAGVPFEALLQASRVGAISLRYYDQLHPPPGPLSGRSYRELRASAGRGSEHLSQLFAAFGLAEPEPDSQLTVDDDQLVSDMLATVVETGQPDLALRAIRMFGEGARRAADGALGVYGEAVDRTGGDLAGPAGGGSLRASAAAVGAVRRPVAPAAREWLASQHLSRAIDEYSVIESERIILEDAGFVASAAKLQPAVAFVDLTGFTRLTEERGDEVAAAIATAPRRGDARRPIRPAARSDREAPRGRSARPVRRLADRGGGDPRPAGRAARRPDCRQPTPGWRAAR